MESEKLFMNFEVFIEGTTLRTAQNLPPVGWRKFNKTNRNFKQKVNK